MTVVFRMIPQVTCYVQLNFPGMMTSTLYLIDTYRLHISFDRVRRMVRHAELDISEDYFLACLYPKGLGNPNDVERGFLRSGLLIKVRDFSINYLPTNRTSDLLCAFHITIILRGIRRARIRRRPQSE